ncbi:MAG: hypothetical protein RR131_07155 [Anaerovorax sp.]
MGSREKEIHEEVDAIEKAHNMQEEVGQSSSVDGLAHIVDNGNVTRQIMNAIGMDSLQTYQSKGEKGKD